MVRRGGVRRVMGWKAYQNMLKTRAMGSRRVRTVRSPGTATADGCMVTPSVSCNGTPHRAVAVVKTSRTVVPAAWWREMEMM